jgi:hypothetical protein
LPDLAGGGASAAETVGRGASPGADHADGTVGPGAESRRPPDWDLYRALRDQWTHEDDVMNHRTMWLILSQGLLFTAYGTLSRSGHNWLIVGFPFFGIVVAAVIGVSIFAAVEATAVVQKQFNEAGLSVLCNLTPTVHTRNRGRLAARVLPLVFGALWLLALVTSL